MRFCAGIDVKAIAFEGYEFVAISHGLNQFAAANTHSPDRNVLHGMFSYSPN